MQQQPGLILSQDPAVRMQQLQQHPEITSPGYPMMQVSWSQQAALVAVRLFQIKEPVFAVSGGKRQCCLDLSVTDSAKYHSHPFHAVLASCFNVMCLLFQILMQGYRCSLLACTLMPCKFP